MSLLPWSLSSQVSHPEGLSSQGVSPPRSPLLLGLSSAEVSPPRRSPPRGLSRQVSAAPWSLLPGVSSPQVSAAPWSLLPGGLSCPGTRLCPASLRAQHDPEGPERELWVPALCRGGRWLHIPGAAPTPGAESSGGSAPRGPAVVLSDSFLLASSVDGRLQ